MLPEHVASLSTETLLEMAPRLARVIADAREVLGYMPADLEAIVAELHKRGQPLPAGLDVTVSADGRVSLKPGPARPRTTRQQS